MELLCQKLEQDYSEKIKGTGTNEIAQKRNFFFQKQLLHLSCLHEEADATIDEAVEASIDGGLDHGIDSVLIDSNHTIWLVQTKY